MKNLLLSIVFIVVIQAAFCQQTVTKPYLASEKELAFYKDFAKYFSNSNSYIVDIKQGWGKLMKNKSTNGNNIKIKNKNYTHGLGVHANSEVKVVLKDKGKKLFAEVGYDNNNQTTDNAENRIIFIVESNGKILWKSGPLYTSEEPLKVEINLKGAKVFTLKVVSATQSSNYCHADWAEINVELENGEKLWLDDLMDESIIMKMPFSFDLDGQSSSVFLSEWNSNFTDSVLTDRVIHKCKWTRPDGSFEVKCQSIEFLKHPAVEWKLSFKNTSTVNSPVLTNVKSLDMQLRTNTVYEPIFLNCNAGSTNSRFDFMPIKQIIEVNDIFQMNSRNGRSSEQFLPFWNLECNGHGFVTAIGWSGNWKADFSLQFGGQTQMSAGMSNIETYLKPGEEIGLPTVCVLYWEGTDAARGTNLFRRYMNDVIVPKWNGKAPLAMAVMGGASSLEGVCEENQLSTIKAIAGTGADIYWMDAGWYGNGPDGKWTSGRGNWFPEKSKFPNGMRPIADEAHKNGLKFMLWFEPENVNTGTEIAVKHPEFVIRKNEKAKGLYNLGNPDGLKYITELISKCLIDWDVDVFRTDYNIEPESYWQMADETGRKGITEIQYIDGLYKFWDALRAAKPNILIDNCASGGRRIDYETCKRSIPMWRSDYQCAAHEDMYEAGQNESYGLNMYLPFNSSGWGMTNNKYKDRSMANGNASVGLYGNYKDGNPILFYLGMNEDPHTPLNISKEKVKSIFDDLKQYNYLMNADYYPLTEFSLTNKVWMAIQYDSPEKGEGCVICFRRTNAPFAEAEFQLYGIDIQANYKLIYLNSGMESLVLGEQLLKLPVRLNKEESEVVKYIKQ